MNLFKTVIASALLAAASTGSVHAASSLAFVDQIETGASASLDTAAIMRPLETLMAATPRVDTSGLAGNLSYVLQEGSFNSASLTQSGTQNVGLIQQIGYGNFAQVSQVGVGHQAFVYQQGRNNTAIIAQR